MYITYFLVVSNNAIKNLSLKNTFSETPVSIKDLGKVKDIRGIRVRKMGNAVLINREKYVKGLFGKFGMANAKPVSTSIEVNFKPKPAPDVPYKNLIGCLCVLKYLKATIDYSLHYTLTRADIIRFADADCVNNEMDSKSYTKYIFKFADEVIS